MAIGPAPSIDARAAWRSDTRECRKLYRQFVGYFAGNFRTIQAYYGWKREAMARALRIGRVAS